MNPIDPNDINLIASDLLDAVAGQESADFTHENGALAATFETFRAHRDALRSQPAPSHEAIEDLVAVGRSEFGRHHFSSGADGSAVPRFLRLAQVAASVAAAILVITVVSRAHTFESKSVTASLAPTQTLLSQNATSFDGTTQAPSAAVSPTFAAASTTAQATFSHNSASATKSALIDLGRFDTTVELRLAALRGLELQPTFDVTTTLAGTTSEPTTTLAPLAATPLSACSFVPPIVETASFETLLATVAGRPVIVRLDRSTNPPVLQIFDVTTCAIVP